MTQPAEQCCVCGSPNVTYHNYSQQPFCWPCADCQCALTPCVRETLYNPEAQPTQPAARHTADTITSNALDQLHARAEKAEAAIERVRAECTATLESRHSHQFRRDQCERILAALDPQEPQP
ncbi:hypothetical protein OG393_21085 [Streptomyces sp. NBC_01216]|uniref:hypothetical protein n=1 Tax=Streptomyces sp. NBC_01216 TaxID=2903778 RepID=UPI002E105482|nr:hypothetical protein OG393_21085 [Streptomyces sp. NBC_01216]